MYTKVVIVVDDGEMEHLCVNRILLRNNDMKARTGVEVVAVHAQSRRIEGAGYPIKTIIFSSLSRREPGNGKGKETTLCGETIKPIRLPL